MTSPARDTSELTAYTLGELNPQQAGEIHELLANCPAALTELEQIEAVTDALRQHAPLLNDRLKPEQRHAVLHPANLPRRVTPMMPRAMVKKQASGWPILGALMKAAALLTVTGAAYWAGLQAHKPAPIVVIQPDIPAQPVTIKKDVLPALKPSTQLVSVAVPPEKVAPAKVTVQAAPKIENPKAPEAPKIVQAAPKQEARVVVGPAPVVQTPVAVVRPSKDIVFVSTSSQEVDQFALSPAQFRPAPVKTNRDQNFASQAPVTVVPEIKTDVKVRAPEIYIHSWKAETVSCPWNQATRLLRVTVQLPVDQPAATTAQSYPLSVSFDRRYVREFRRLSERHLPAAELRSAGMQTVWYEFQPVSEDTLPSGKQIATVTLDKGRFTTQTVGPFDGSKLNVLDRGAKWETAREEYLFEAAVVGLGMLLRGDHQSPSLNHQVIQALAEKSKGNDASGERARFLKQLADVRRAAGL
jgi:hypothetical protein